MKKSYLFASALLIVGLSLSACGAASQPIAEIENVPHSTIKEPNTETRDETVKNDESFDSVESVKSYVRDLLDESFEISEDRSQNVSDALKGRIGQSDKSSVKVFFVKAIDVKDSNEYYDITVDLEWFTSIVTPSETKTQAANRVIQFVKQSSPSNGTSEKLNLTFNKESKMLEIAK